MAASVQLNLDKGMTAVGFLSALIDSGLVDKQMFLSELSKSQIFDTVQIVIKNEYPQGKKATRAVIIDTEKLQGKLNNRSINDVLQIISSSNFDSKIGLAASRVFENYASAWQETNSSFLLNEYFDNVSIITVISICIYLSFLDASYLYAPKINLGSGIVISSTQAQKVPRDIVKYLLKDFSIYEGSHEGELVDPMFAAVLSVYLRQSKISIKGSDVKVCYGLGDKDYALYDDFYKILITTGQNIKEEDGMVNFNESVSDGAIKEAAQSATATANLKDREQQALSNVDKLSKKLEAITTLMDELDQSLKDRKSKLSDIQDKYQEDKKANLQDSDVLIAKREIKIDTRGVSSEPENMSKIEKSESFELLAKIRNLEEKLIQTSKNRNSSVVNDRGNESEPKIDKDKTDNSEVNHIIELTSNIDNSTGEELGFLAELMLANNAHDVYFEPIFTNSFKPAYKITALIDEKDLVLFSRLILLNSGAALVKYATFSTIQSRSERVIKNGKYGDVAFDKIEGRDDTAVYEDRKRIAQKYGLSLKQVEKILGEEYE